MDADLRTFLRDRRRRIDPVSAGLPVPTGRRSIGLSRDDVAELLDVTPLWYGLFESGTSTRRFSRAFLDRVSIALRLDPTERETFFCLVVANGNAAPDVELAWSRKCWSSLMAIAADARRRIADTRDPERCVELVDTSLVSMLSIAESWRWPSR